MPFMLASRRLCSRINSIYSARRKPLWAAYYGDHHTSESKVLFMGSGEASTSPITIIWKEQAVKDGLAHFRPWNYTMEKHGGRKIQLLDIIAIAGLEMCFHLPDGKMPYMLVYNVHIFCNYSASQIAFHNIEPYDFDVLRHGQSLQKTKVIMHMISKEKCRRNHHESLEAVFQ